MQRPRRLTRTDPGSGSTSCAAICAPGFIGHGYLAISDPLVASCPDMFAQVEALISTIGGAERVHSLPVSDFRGCKRLGGGLRLALPNAAVVA